MARKLTYKEVKHYIEAESGSGCKLLSEEYARAKDKLNIQCACGNEYEVSYDMFKSRKQYKCEKCRKNTLWNYDKIKRFIEIDSGSNCKIISNKYININTPIKIMCSCGDVFSTTFAQFKHLNKRQCNKCGYSTSSEKQRQSYEYVKNFIEVESNSGCKLLSSDYINCDEYISIQCNCGNIFDTTFARFKRANKKQCNECGRRVKRKTNEQFQREIYDLVSDEYIFLEEYCGSTKKIKCRHNSCRNEYYVTPSMFLSGSRCPKCYGKFKKTTEQFKNEVYDLVGEEYVVLSEYITNKSLVVVRHNVCNHEYKVAPSNFLRGKRCPKCNGGVRKTQEEFEEEVYNLYKDEYKVIGEYKTYHNSRIKVKHNVCGNVYDAIPSVLLKGIGCSICSESKGESKIREILNNNHIRFSKEHTFSDLLGVGGYVLRFDFAILNKESVVCLIEYDGEFHYQDIYEDGSFAIQQIHDKRKNQYCKENNIPLIRIPYWQLDKIETILDKWLKKYNLIEN